MQPLCLISGSLRRRSLLETVGIPLTVMISKADETWPWPAGDVDVLGAVLIARRKLAAGYRQLCQDPLKYLTEEQLLQPVLALAADTIVVVAGQILGKPRDHQDATAMLNLLSGREHQVATGFCLLKFKPPTSFTQDLGLERETRELLQTDFLSEAVVTTTVKFRQLTAAEIANYLATAEPWDKAGAYGIQSNAGAFVDYLQGSYTNIMGLPLKEVLAAIERFTKS